MLRYSTFCDRKITWEFNFCAFSKAPRKVFEAQRFLKVCISFSKIKHKKPLQNYLGSSFPKIEFMESLENLDDHYDDFSTYRQAAKICRISVKFIVKNILKFH